jgi:hypothetical protein
MPVVAYDAAELVITARCGTVTASLRVDSTSRTA